MVEIINSLEDLCRLCAGKVDVLMGINIFESDHRQIFKKICVCLPIQISVNDSFPKMVCVECACKLDLMFDFRERSILTAHLFSDMMTVNNGSIISGDQTLQIESQTASNESDFSNEEFMCCKLEAIKYSNEVESSVSNETEAIIGQESTISNDTQKSLVNAKNKIETRSSKKKINESRIKDIVQLNSIKSTNSIEKEPSITSRELCQTVEQNLDSDVANKNLSNSNLELSSISATGAVQNINNCSVLDWFFCNTCDKTFSNRETFEYHNNKHLSKEQVSECDDVKEVNTETIQNKKKKTKQKKAVKLKGGGKKSESKVCMECGKQYQTNYKLQEHMRKHTGEKPFLCSYQDCKKAFRSKIGLAQHEANHSGQFEFSCSTCGKGFQCKSYLVVHQRVHSDIKPFVCKQCSRRFKTKQSLLDHMNRHLGVKPFLCDICGRGFITKGLCKSHQKVHSGTDNRQYPCNVCRKLFVSKSYLNTHFRIHTGEKPFMCEVCGKGFLTRVDLRIHSTMHTGEKSFVCEMCGKAFARRDALRCHRRSHTGERPYKCEFCGQSFTQFSPMAIHKRLHTGERPYECDVCNKTFVSRSTMIAHKKKNHAANNEESQYRFVSVEVPQELNEREEQPSEQLVVIEDPSQLLLALSKRHSINESSSEALSFNKMKSDCSGVPVE